MTLEIAKRLALGYGLWLLNAGVLPAVARVERQICGMFLADLIDSSREARDLVLNSEYFSVDPEQMCRDYCGRPFLAVTQAVIRHSRGLGDVAECVCYRLLELGLRA